MSSSSVNGLLGRLDGSLPALSESLLVPVRGIAFWTAIALPFLHIPLLAAGLDTPATRTAFAVLLVCNVFALLVGHSYRSD